jgi:cystathionine beta-lyase family protein involved in aluminum resistance
MSRAVASPCLNTVPTLARYKEDGRWRVGRKVIARGEGRSANRTKWAHSSAKEEEEEGGTFGVLPLSERQIDQVGDWGRSSAIAEAVQRVSPLFAEIDALVQFNISKVQEAFRACRIGPHHFGGSTGYGHGDLGRAALDEVMARILGAEAAALRIQFVSGTHAIASALFGCLRPGDELLAVAGDPYDTLEEVIGVRKSDDETEFNVSPGSLIDFGVKYRKLELDSQGRVDWEGLETAIRPETKVVLVQRSCGYALRPSLSIKEIGRIVQCVKSQNRDVIVAVDNCYGEFTDRIEPPSVGADLCMGSLIKNPGGTIVPGGGYVAGRSELVQRAVNRLYAPGVGTDAGCVNGDTLRLMFQGLFLAPQTVGEALKGGRLIADVVSNLSLSTRVLPPPGSCNPWSFITAVELGSPQRMEAFCRAVQRKCPIGSYVLPVPGVTPGYGDPVIFADGTFIDGSTAELSADGPLRPPYVVYCQGGTHWTHWAIVLEEVLRSLDASID